MSSRAHRRRRAARLLEPLVFVIVATSGVVTGWGHCAPFCSSLPSVLHVGWSHPVLKPKVCSTTPQKTHPCSEGTCRAVLTHPRGRRSWWFPEALMCVYRHLYAMLCFDALFYSCVKCLWVTRWRAKVCVCVLFFPLFFLLSSPCSNLHRAMTRSDTWLRRSRKPMAEPRCHACSES